MKSINILLIEDNPDDAGLIQFVLQKKIKNEVVITHIDSFILFKELIKKPNFDLILTDYNCGEFNGTDVITELNNSNLDIPIILITAESGMDTALTAINLHVDDYIVKDSKYTTRLPNTVTRVLKNAELESTIRNANTDANETLYNYVSMFVQTADLILSLWGDGSFITANQALLEILGYHVNELKKINIKNIVDKDCYIELDSIISDKSMMNSCQDIQIVLVSKSGKKINVKGKINKRIENGKVIGTHWNVQCLTDSKKLDELRLKQSEQYKSVFEHAPFPMVMGDVRGIVLQINQAACDLVGYSYEEMLGRHIRSITHPLDLLKSLRYHKKLTSGEIDDYVIEKRYRHKDGHYIKVEVTAALIRNKKGKPRFAIAEFKSCSNNLMQEKEDELSSISRFTA